MGAIDDAIKQALDGLHTGSLMPGYDAAETITLQQPAAGEYDPQDGAIVADEGEIATDISAKALISEYSIDEIIAGGGLVEQGDLRIIMRAEHGMPSMNSLIIRGGETFRIISIRPRMIGGAIYDYEIQARR